MNPGCTRRIPRVQQRPRYLHEGHVTAGLSREPKINPLELVEAGRDKRTYQTDEES